MNHSRLPLRFAALSVVSLTALMVLTGCGLGPAAPPSAGNDSIPLPALQGRVNGGQQPISGAAIQLLVAGSTGYGSAATYTTGNNLLGNNTVTTSDGTGTGISITASSINAAGTVATFTTSANTLAAGNTVDLAGFTTTASTFLNGQAVTVAASPAPTSTSFSATVTGGTANAGGTNTGTGVAVLASGNDANANVGNEYNTMPLGSFTITGDYTCPSSTSLVYFMASGGNPGIGQGTNSAIKLVAALGPCGNLTTSTLTNINEITTIGAAFALGQFFTPTFGSSSADTFGAPSSNSIGITNAFATAATLVNTSTGNPSPTTAANGTNYYLTANDQQKINTMGNILADCVNSSGPTSTSCNSLFTAVTPTYAPLSTSTAATKATDTLQAAVYMSLNPTSTNSSSSSTNMGTLIGLQTPYESFPNALSAQPTDWTLAVQYSNSNISLAGAVAVDANGDIWLTNSNTSGGVVLLNGGTGTYGGTAGVTGGVIGFYNSISINSTATTPSQPRGVAIDLNGKAWFGDFSPHGSSYYMYRANHSSGIDAYYGLPSPLQQPYAEAIDPTGSYVFITTTVTSVGKVSTTATSGANVTAVTLETNGGSDSIAIDTNGVAYIPSNSNNNLAEFTTSNSTAVSGSPYTSSTLTSNLPYGDAVDGNGLIWITNNNASSIVKVSGSGSSATFTSYSSSCLSGARYNAIDGNNNIWVANSNAATVCEFNNSGTLISNSTGFGSHGLNTSRGIAIDPAGNVWVSNYTTVNNVTEIVGAAVPVITPLASALNQGKLGTRP